MTVKTRRTKSAGRAKGKRIKAQQPPAKYWQRDIELHQKTFDDSTACHKSEKKYFAIYSSDWSVLTEVGDSTVSFGSPSRHTPYFDTMDEVVKWMNENNIHLGKTFEVENHETAFEDNNTYIFPITRIEFLYRYTLEYTGNIHLQQHMLAPDGEIVHQESRRCHCTQGELQSDSEQLLKQTLYTSELKPQDGSENRVGINIANCLAYMGKSRKDLGEI